MESYELIRSRRKTLALEITRDCRVLVRAPANASQASIEAFVTTHEHWLQTHLERQRLRMASAPPPPTPEEIGALKARAWAVLPGKVAYWSRKMGLVPTGLKIDHCPDPIWQLQQQEQSLLLLLPYGGP